MLDRTRPPLTKDPVEFSFVLPPINREELPNGIPFYWLEAGVQEVVEIDWVFPAGIWQESKPAVAQSVAALLRNGTGKRSAQEINEAFEAYGATLSVGAGEDWASVTLYTLSKHLPALLPLVREVIEEAAFPEEELRIYKENTVQRLLVSLLQCDFVANQRIDALLFGEAHPYGRYTKKEKVEALTREDLVAFHKRYYNLGNAQIFAGGHLSPAHRTLLRNLFGDIKTSDANVAPPAAIYSAPAPSDRVQRISNDANGVQGAIRVGRLFPTREHPDFAPMVVLNTVMGGYFGSRLMSNIREDKGYTYGISSSIQPLLNGGSLIIHTEAGREVCELAVKEIWKELQHLQEVPVDKEELLLVKNYLLGGLLGALDGPFQLLARWKSLILNGFNEAKFQDNIRIYKTVDATMLQELAQKYYNREDFYEIVVV
jgi:predicted Zn-dependent peptidase